LRLLEKSSSEYPVEIADDLEAQLDEMQRRRGSD